ncbi:septum site-determining protein Ssd [Georgenia subflava]|uniref:Septum site determining protein n=1 Tax=Georgenia subflava TaxID=1622177 RepID=A0A6N7EJY5_9MICO|nr:septum site-determining protein Ssd [Georgenia subflava]MPV37398.1 hypothetical protein [Georgenia subflava]
MGTSTRMAEVVLRTGDGVLADQVRRLTDLAGIALVVVPEDRVLPAAAVTLDAGPTGDLAVRVDPVRVQPAAVTDAVPTSVRLPADDATLLDVLVMAGTPHRARTVGVVGAHGGAGASVLAAGLARACVGAGAATALVDLDPAGGGLDVLLGLEHDPGRRWADVHGERGALLPEQLALALPTWHLVRVLSGDRRGGAQAEDLVVRSAVRALGQGHDVVVLDLPRQVLAPGPAQELWLGWCADLVLLTCGGVRGGAAAQAVGGLAGTAVPVDRVHLVVRERGQDAEDIAAAAGLALTARMRDERALPAGIEHGVTPGDQRRGGVMTTARALVEKLGLDP